MAARKQLFRPQALQHYARQRERDVLPRMVAPPVFLCGWILLSLLLLATLLAWQAQLPIYDAAAGVIIQDGQAIAQSDEQATALLFVSATPALEAQAGQTISLELEVTGGPSLEASGLIEPGVVTPDEARQRYMLTGDLALVIRQPSVVVRVALGAAFSAPEFDGRSMRARVCVGSQSVLSLLPDLLKAFLGG